MLEDERSKAEKMGDFKARKWVPRSGRDEGGTRTRASAAMDTARGVVVEGETRSEAEMIDDFKRLYAALQKLSSEDI